MSRLKELIYPGLKQNLLRIPALILAGAGLTYPVCAAVCPKGIGSCPSPGRCFLYTDSDSNSICDYTSSGVSTRGSSSGSGTNTVVPSQGSVSTSPTVATQSTGTTSNGFFDVVGTSNLAIGILLFVSFTLGLLWAFRTGKIETGLKRKSLEIVLAALLALGPSEILVYYMSSAAAYASIFALGYMIIGTLLVIILWRSGGLSRRMILAVAGLSSLTGFAFAAPIMPTEFTSLVNVLVGQQTLTIALIAILAVFGLTFLFGRMFCAHICPVGSIQEFVYGVIPGRKILVENSKALEISRFIIFLLTIAAGIYTFNLIQFTGLYEFFAGTWSGVFFIGLLLVVISIVVYRPICRVICPFGVIFSILAHFGLGNIRRTSSCIQCRKCESVCPVHAAGPDDSKRECYLCGRCVETCPKDALYLSGTNLKKNDEK